MPEQKFSIVVDADQFLERIQAQVDQLPNPTLRLNALSALRAQVMQFVVTLEKEVARG